MATMPGVLTVTSQPLRTSPTVRGKWVLEELLGGKVPPPPPNVGELPEGKSARGCRCGSGWRCTARPAECAACHPRMDPLGFGLENFDPVGKWRTEVDGKPVDDAGELPGGAKFAGPEQLKKRLLDRKDEFATHLTKKVLGYALGRQLYPFDDCVLDEALQALRADGYKAVVMFERIVMSYPFRHRYVKK